MLTITGLDGRFCDGISRRSFLAIGGLDLSGISLTWHRRPARPVSGFERQTNVSGRQSPAHSRAGVKLPTRR